MAASGTQKARSCTTETDLSVPSAIKPNECLPRFTILSVIHSSSTWSPGLGVWGVGVRVWALGFAVLVSGVGLDCHCCTSMLRHRHITVEFHARMLVIPKTCKSTTRRTLWRGAAANGCCW